MPRASRARTTTTPDEPVHVSLRRVADTPGAAKRKGKTKKAELPKESIPGDNTKLANMGKHENAYIVGVYVKHESTEDVIERLGLSPMQVTGDDGQPRNATLGEKVAVALTKKAHAREYHRLGKDSDLPETVGITWRMNIDCWPFPNVRMKAKYDHWELVDLGEVPARVKAAADDVSERMGSFYNPDGTVKAQDV